MPMKMGAGVGSLGLGLKVRPQDMQRTGRQPPCITEMNRIQLVLKIGRTAGHLDLV
jgi:hypothetical protein